MQFDPNEAGASPGGSQGRFPRSREAFGAFAAALVQEGRQAFRPVLPWVGRSRFSWKADGQQSDDWMPARPGWVVRLRSRAVALADRVLGRLRRRPNRRLVLSLGGMAAVLVVASGWVVYDLPWKEISDDKPETVVVLAATDGQPLLQQGPYRAAYADSRDFPRHLIDAVTTAEDRRFFDHAGIDLFGIGRAVVSNVMAGDVVEGGSTITQQLAKVSYLSPDRTLKRKLQEAAIALWLDGSLSKDEILTRYLNSIFLGAGATGVPAAAHVYFGKEAKDLTLGESAMIAGLIRAPSVLNPIKDLKAARERANAVLEDMAATGKIDAAELDKAKAEVKTIKPVPASAKSGSWFADWIAEDSRSLVGSFEGTIKVSTTLDPRLQALAEQAVNETLDEFGDKYDASQAALVAMTPDGAVVAMVGGRNYKESQFNRAVSALRQPGSTFKLFVYHAALKAGIPVTARIIDQPIEIDGWAPENNSGKYQGRVSIAEAFAKSLNSPSVMLAMEVGLDKVAASARELGIDARLVETPSLALGTSEVSLLDLTGAFASVRAGLAPIEPYGMAEFSVEGQERSFNLGPARLPTVKLPDQRELVGLLRLVVERGTGREAELDDFAAGKTGTSQDYRDAWFVGFTEPLVAGVWVGNDDNSPMKGVTGGDLPAVIWRRFMEKAMEQPQPVDTEAVTASIKTEDGEGAAMSCNIDACERAYRSFRAEDCTYRPYGSRDRKLCEK